MNTLTANNPTNALHLANIAAKAATLFTTGGYSYLQGIINADKFMVCNPTMRANPALPTYTVCITTGKRSCDCIGFQGAGECSHVLACEEEARLIALVADYDGRDENYTLPAPVAPVAPVAAWEACDLCGTALEEAGDGGLVSFCGRCEKWAI